MKNSKNILVVALIIIALIMIGLSFMAGILPPGLTGLGFIIIAYLLYQKKGK